MMSVSPYLVAVQELPGKTPGEKYKELNLIAKRIVVSQTNPGDHDIMTVEDFAVPFHSLLKLEISQALRLYKGVIKGLKSKDRPVVYRALRMNWFFKGSHTSVINVEYFENNVLPYVSLNTRIQLIKRFAKNLRATGETQLSEEFYNHFAIQYGRKQAEPLLIACSENFVYNEVINNRIKLSCRTVKILFITNPHLVIRYLKSFKPMVEKWAGTSFNNGIGQYSDFMSRLIKKHSRDFIELYEMHNYCFDIKLSNNKAKTLLKNNIGAVLNKPKLYVYIMPLKIVAAKLTKLQFKSIIPKMFPKRWQDFRYSRLIDLLQHYPKQERAALVIDSYKIAYNANFLNNHEVVDEYFLCILPQEERARQARIKMENNPNWLCDGYDITRAWKCYLPIDESIALIKNELAETSDEFERTSLLKQMFYTCLVNEDMEALRKSLIYLANRHKHEATSVIAEVLEDLGRRIDPSRLSKDHWKILNNLIHYLHDKGEVKKLREIIIAAIHFNLIHDLPIDDKIEMLLGIDIRLDTWQSQWSILEKYPEYDRRCIDAFMTMMPRKYPESDEIWNLRGMQVIERIVKAIYNFNTRNIKSNCTVEKISIKNYPWLVRTVKNLVQRSEVPKKSIQDSIISILKIHEKDLYRDWLVMEPRVVDLTDFGERALRRLNRDPKNILDNWEKYLERALSNIHLRCTQLFIRKARWHKDIAFRFVELCHSDFDTGKAPSPGLQVLGILLKGNEYGDLVGPLIPKSSKINIINENDQDSWERLKNIPKGMNLTDPTVSLKLIQRLCKGEYLHLGLITLTNACRRTSIEKIKPFIRTHIHRKGDAHRKKYEIRLYCLVTPMEEHTTFLSQLWRDETDRSIRAVVFEKIYNLFVTKADDDTWSIMRSCIAGLNVDDQTDFPKITDLQAIPVEYIGDYVVQLFDSIEILEDEDFDEKLTNKLVSYVLGTIDESIGHRLSEQLLKRLLFKYFFDMRIHPDVRAAGLQFVLNVYFPCAGEKLAERLHCFCGKFESLLRSWSAAHREDSCFFPINALAHNFMTSLVHLDSKYTAVRNRTMEAILRSFLKVLKPECDAFAYVLLSYGIALKDAQTPRDIVRIICETLPQLVQTLYPTTYYADGIHTWLRILVQPDKVEEVMYDLIENLCEIGTDHACWLAAILLFLCRSRKFDDRHKRIIEFLRSVEYPAVVSLVYLDANTKCFLNY